MSNASPVVFGFDFQFHAAIYIMLKHIEDAVSVRVEGENEDVEISLINEYGIFSQAKSFTNPNDGKNAISKLSKALQSLDSASKYPKTSKTIYVTNSSNPFNNNSLTNYFIDVKSYRFEDLPEYCRGKISEIINKLKLNNLDLTSFEVWTLPFIGDEPNRYATVKRLISEFLINIKQSDGMATKLLDTWQNRFSHNASKQDTSIKITKEEMMWSLIVIAIDLNPESAEVEGFDPSLAKLLSNRFSDFINSKGHRFDFATRVITSYEDYCQTHNISSTNSAFQNFILEEWCLFRDEFSGVFDDLETEKTLIMLIVRKILGERLMIREIKRKVNIL